MKTLRGFRAAYFHGLCPTTKSAYEEVVGYFDDLGDAVNACAPYWPAHAVGVRDAAGRLVSYLEAA